MTAPQDMDAPSTTASARQLLDQHLVMLRSYARHLVSDPGDADDVVQDVCVEVLASPAILLRGNDPGAYLRGIARHLSSRHHRRFRRHQAIEEFVDLCWSEPSNPVMADEERARQGTALAACMKELPERMRTIFSQRYRQGLNATEIGRDLALSADAVRMALLRGRQTLTRCLGRRLGPGMSELLP